MTTYTDNLDVPHLGQNVAQPEVPVNESMDIFDAAIAGVYNVPMTPDTTYLLDDTSLTYPQEWHNGILIIDAVNTISTQLHLPDGRKMRYVLDNRTGFDIVFKTVTGTGVTVPSSGIYSMYSDGINIARIL